MNFNRESEFYKIEFITFREGNNLFIQWFNFKLLRLRLQIYVKELSKTLKVRKIICILYLVHLKNQASTFFLWLWYFGSNLMKCPQEGAIKILGGGDGYSSAEVGVPQTQKELLPSSRNGWTLGWELQIASANVWGEPWIKAAVPKRGSIFGKRLSWTEIVPSHFYRLSWHYFPLLLCLLSLCSFAGLWPLILAPHPQ